MATIKTRQTGERSGARHGMVVLNVGPLAAASAVDGNIFVADKRYRVVSIEAAWDTVSTSGYVQITKCASTTVASVGTALMSAGFNTSTAVNTVNTGTLVATEASLQVEDGDRLCLYQTGTITGLVGMAITIVLLPLPDQLNWISR